MGKIVSLINLKGGVGTYLSTISCVKYDAKTVIGLCAKWLNWFIIREKEY